MSKSQPAQEDPNRPLIRHPGVVLKPCSFGMGVFTTAFVPQNTIVEECPYLKIKRDDIHSGLLNNRTFKISDIPGAPPEECGFVALALGFGSIYNHNWANNVSYYHVRNSGLFVFYSVRDIQPGEQLCISYGKEWWKARGEEPRAPEGMKGGESSAE